MTKLVIMKPWTLETMQARLAEMSNGDGDPEKVALRQHILEIATEHFARFGYRRANVGDIAREAGIGKGSLYLHFDSKHTLLLAAVALVRGDSELKRLVQALGTDFARDRERGLALLESFIGMAAPHLSQESTRVRAETLAAVLGLPAHIESSPIQMELPVETFVDAYAAILVAGLTAPEAA